MTMSSTAARHPRAEPKPPPRLHGQRAWSRRSRGPRSGALWRGLVLAVFAACGTRVDQASSEEGARRLLVVGWDGASFRMLDRLLAEGRLPSVGALLERGVQARFESTLIPISAGAWTSAVTGKGPGETGVYSFFEPVPDSYDVRLTSSLSVRAAPLWRILTQRGRRSVVFGVPLTWPPEPIAGTLVAGMLSPFDAAYAWPPEFTDELRARGFVPDLDEWTEVRPVDWNDLERQLRIKREVVGELLAADDWAFAMVVFKSLDVVSHLGYGVDFASHVGPLYERLDEILGQLVASVGPETDVLLISDHGFRLYDRGFNLHAWLLARGFSVASPSAARLAVDERAPFGKRARQILLQLRGELDWSRTVAFAGETEGNCGGIRLNVRGREPAGIVAPDEVAALITRLETELAGVVDADGAPLVSRVLRGAELYPGPHDRVVPDLLFELADGCQAFSDVEQARVFGAYELPFPEHEREGILIAAGPSFVHVRERGDARIADLAPTVLHLLGESVPADMTGAVLLPLLTGKRDVSRRVEAPLPRPAGGVPADPAPRNDARDALERRLRRTGYGD